MLDLPRQELGLAALEALIDCYTSYNLRRLSSTSVSSSLISSRPSTTCGLRVRSWWHNVERQRRDSLVYYSVCTAQPREDIEITLPDGSKRGGKSWETSPMDIALQISKGLADRIVIAKACSTVMKALFFAKRELITC